jgi:hypothetical protein
MALIKTNARSATALDATILTGNLPAINGSALTNLVAGKIGQVVHSKNTTYRSITSTTFVECNSVTITPSATSSKILVFNSACITKNNASQGTERMFRVVGGSDVATQVLTDLVAYTNNTDVNNVGFSGTQFYDTPSSVAAITYSYRICSTGDTSSVEYNNYSSAGSFSGQITAMEILA